jgi:hypothetical protein
MNSGHLNELHIIDTFPINLELQGGLLLVKTVLTSGSWV